MTARERDADPGDEERDDDRDEADRRVDDAVAKPTPIASVEALVEDGVRRLVAPPPAREDDAHPLEALLGRWGRVAVPLAVVAGGAAAGQLYGPPGVVLVLAATALVAIIALFWQSLRTALGETPLSGADAYALGAPRLEEEQKRSVLRALKDLEFERSVGKISEADYRVLVTQYRAEAKRLLRLIDEHNAPQRRRAEALVNERLTALGLATQAARDAEAARVAAAREGDEAGRDEGDGAREAEVKAPLEAEPEPAAGEDAPAAEASADAPTDTATAETEAEAPKSDAPREAKGPEEKSGE